MSIDRILNMIIRRVIMTLVNKGVNGGINALAKRTSRPKAQSSQDMAERSQDPSPKNDQRRG